MKKREWDEESR